MKNDYRVDPELRSVLQNYPSIDLNLENLPTIREERAIMTREMNAQLPKIEEVTQEDRMVPRSEGGPYVKIRIYKPIKSGNSLPGFFWIHGGVMF